ncbi:MAG: hypothetical protein P8045_15540, partial [Candidatus Thiodiazotropha sp.]
LFRQPLPGFQCGLEPDELAGMACFLSCAHIYGHFYWPMPVFHLSDGAPKYRKSIRTPPTIQGRKLVAAYA